MVLIVAFKLWFPNGSRVSSETQHISLLSMDVLLLSEQILSSSAQDRAPPGPRLRRALPAVREWECERRSHGDGSGVPLDGAGAPNPADAGRVPSEQIPTFGSEEAHEGRDRTRPEEGDSP